MSYFRVSGWEVFFSWSKTNIFFEAQLQHENEQYA